MRGRVLVVAGSDSGGGAGIQADSKACLALGAHASTAITALTAQNTLGMHGVMPVPADFVRRQMLAVLDDIGADAVKTGMLGSTDVIAAVIDVLAGRRLPLVVDPVMIAKGGAALLDPDAVGALRTLARHAALLTPNVPEAEALLDRTIAHHGAAMDAARSLLGLGAAAVLLKGGHLPGSVTRDILATPGGIEVLENPRIDTRHTHGTGCTLASAIAAGLAQELPLATAVRRARAYVQAAIATAPGLGAGHGPLNHGVSLDPARFG